MSWASFLLANPAIQEQLRRSSQPKATPDGQLSVIHDYRLTAVLLALVGGVIALPYLFRARPRSRREWRWVAAALLFLFWLLAGLQVLRAETAL